MKKFLETLFRAFLGGMCIAIGGTVLLSLKDGSLGGSIAGALFFSLGLLTIVTRGLNLYTGKIGDLLHNPPSYLGTLGIVWLGNFAGTFVTALIIRLTRVGGALSEKAKVMCQAKLDDSLLSIFILSCMCGVLMYIAVNGYRNMQEGFSRTMIVVLPVAVFILCGFEHCIADMFYYAAAGLSADALIRILVITIGNTAGGMLLSFICGIVNR